jgi:hypothetical protein
MLTPVKKSGLNSLYDLPRISFESERANSIARANPIAPTVEGLIAHIDTAIIVTFLKLRCAVMMSSSLNIKIAYA